MAACMAAARPPVYTPTSLPPSHPFHPGLECPPRFEPCGLNQLYAMRYGTVPVAHKTGGLKDTVLDFDPWNNAGTGWTFTDCSATGLMQSVGLALNTFNKHPEDFHHIQLRGMKRDSSWNQAALQYEQLFDWAAIDEAYCK